VEEKKSLEEWKTTSERKVAELQQRLTQSGTIQENAGANLAQAQEQIRTLKVQLEGLEKQMGAVSQKHIDQVKELSLNNSHQEKQLHELRKEKVELQQQLQKLMEEKNEQAKDFANQSVKQQNQQTDLAAQLQKERNNVQQTISQYTDQIGVLERKNADLQSQLLAIKMSYDENTNAAPKPTKDAISLRDFDISDIVMFSKNSSGVYEAFNRNCPSYFLSEDSFHTFEKERAASLVIIGNVISKEKLVATGSDYTKLAAGKEYYELLVSRYG